MNSDFLAELAGELGTRRSNLLRLLVHPQRQAKYRRYVLGRFPTAEELTLLTGFIESKPEISEDGMPTNLIPERWICGYGKFNAETKSLAEFQRLPKFTGTNWQGEQGPPDAKLGWWHPNREGGILGTI